MAKSKGKDNSNKIIEEQLQTHLTALEGVLKSDVFTYRGPIDYHIDNYIRNCIEDLREGKKRKSPTLTVLLQTNGGYIEVAERIANTFRKHYAHVNFIIPDYAYSAGTVLVLSGDEIYMDYFSNLGPIDPQIQKAGSGMVPASGYLEEYNRLIDKAKTGGLTPEEVSYLVSKFDPAEMHKYKQALKLSVQLLEEWLVKYKFRNWKKTKSRKLQVTLAMKKARAKEIAEKLNNTNEWCSHSRGISMPVISRKLGLDIKDFEKDNDLNDSIRTYDRLLSDYMSRLGQQVVFHTRKNYLAF